MGQQAIYDVLAAADEPLTQVQIAELTGIRKNNVARCLIRLRKGGGIEVSKKTSRNIYTYKLRGKK